MALLNVEEETRRFEEMLQSGFYHVAIRILSCCNQDFIMLQSGFYQSREDEYMRLFGNSEQLEEEKADDKLACTNKE